MVGTMKDVLEAIGFVAIALVVVAILAHAIDSVAPYHQHMIGWEQQACVSTTNANGHLVHCVDGKTLAEWAQQHGR